KALEEIIAAFDKADDPKQKFLMAAKVYQQLHFALIEPSSWPMLVANLPAGLTTYNSSVIALESTRGAKADLLATRAMLALEAGAIPTARKFFRDATERRAFFRGLELAAVYRYALQRANPDK